MHLIISPNDPPTFYLQMDLEELLSLVWDEGLREQKESLELHNFRSGQEVPIVGGIYL